MRQFITSIERNGIICAQMAFSLLAISVCQHPMHTYYTQLLSPIYHTRSI